MQSMQIGSETLSQDVHLLLLRILSGCQPPLTRILTLQVSCWDLLRFRQQPSHACACERFLCMSQSLASKHGHHFQAQQPGRI